MLNKTHKKLLQSDRIENSRGAVLLTVVFVLIIIGLVGSAIYSLTFTSTYTQMNAQNASRAHYIAESGVRIVAAEYNQAAEANKNTTLESLHNETLTLPDNSQIDLRIYPYWFYVNSAYTSGNNTISLRMPGGIPITDMQEDPGTVVNIPTSGRLKLQGKTQRADITSSLIVGNDITFGLGTDKFPYDIDPDEEIFLVYTDNTMPVQTINEDSTLNFPDNNPTDLFNDFLPEKNGSFRIHNENNDRMDYTYSEKINTGGSFSLTGVSSQDPANPSLFPFDVDGTTEIFFGKNLATVATTTLGQGNFAGQKTVVTYNDVGLDGGFNIGRDSISFDEDIEDFNYPGLPMNNPPGLADPIEVDEGAKEINLGGGLNDGYGSVWYGGDSDTSNCIDGRCNLGKGFRAYFEFVSNLTDTSADSTTYGDGFTFSIISGIYDIGPGTYRNSKYDTGGPLGEYLGYAGPGLPAGDQTGLEPPKIALELDTFPNPGAGSLCGANSRNDGPPEANHIALDYWGARTTVTQGFGSLDATGGYMRIGSTSPSEGSPEDWSSSQGTISFWFKLDSVPLGAGDRLWGQNLNMETRFVGNNIVLDWGSGGQGSLSAVHPFTQANKWYFIGIAWDDTADQLRLYWADESNPVTLFAENLFWAGDMSPAGLITENLFMNSSGGDETKVYMIEGNSTDLRYYNVARVILEIESDYDQRLDGTEPQQPLTYYPLESDFANAAALLPTAESVPTTGWSDSPPSVFTDCSSDIATRDDNRHGAGGGTTDPMNSLNTNPGLGDDGYYQVAKTDPFDLLENNWMEDGLDYGVRVELIRPKLASGDGNFDYQIKAWVVCVDATCSDLDATQKANFSDVRATYVSSDPNIELTLQNGNPLELAASVHEDLKSILFGFTQGTGGGTQNITLKNMEMRFNYVYPVSDLSTW